MTGSSRARSRISFVNGETSARALPWKEKSHGAGFSRLCRAMPARSLLAAAAERRRVRRLATLAAKQLPPPRREAASAEERESQRGGRRRLRAVCHLSPARQLCAAGASAAAAAPPPASRLSRPEGSTPSLPWHRGPEPDSRTVERLRDEALTHTGHAAQGTAPRGQQLRVRAARSLVARMYCASVDLVRACAFITQTVSHSQCDS